jgi:histidyl-tRNA synthetase
MSATTTPSLPQGTRDFDAVAVRKRNHIFNTIKSVFERYGFEPLETPALENLTTLTGKYGEEGDQLMYKVLNNGISNPKNGDKAREGFEKAISGKSSPLLTERALRYDLTIPFARYVAMNHGKLTLPLRRYQIQPVWRGDSPQKGRYREFTQCDADIVGSRSLMNEAELVLICRDVFGMLGLDGYRLCINNRKILTALAEVCGAENQSVAITTAIDKLDKIGLDKVCAELAIWSNSFCPGSMASISLLMASPLTIMFSAASTPKTRGNRWVPPAPGMRPSLTSGKATSQPGAAMR